MAYCCELQPSHDPFQHLLALVNTLILTKTFILSCIRRCSLTIRLILSGLGLAFFFLSPPAVELQCERSIGSLSLVRSGYFRASSRAFASHLLCAPDHRQLVCQLLDVGAALRNAHPSTVQASIQLDVTLRVFAGEATVSKSKRQKIV